MIESEVRGKLEDEGGYVISFIASEMRSHNKGETGDDFVYPKYVRIPRFLEEIWREQEIVAADNSEDDECDTYPFLGTRDNPKWPNTIYGGVKVLWNSPEFSLSY